MRVKFSFIIFNILFCYKVFAGGYQVNLVGIRNIGMGHIGTSFYQDAGVIFFNPGNMSFIQNKYSFIGGVSGLFAYTAFQAKTSNITERTEAGISPPFSLFGAVKITDKFSAGIGVYTPFGSRVKWHSDWSGQFVIRDIALRTVLIQPTLSYKITDMISVGAGLVFAYGRVQLNQGIPINSSDGSTGNVELKGSTTNWGFNAGIGIKPTEKLSIGLSYRSRINMNLKNGEANFTVPATLGSNFPPGNSFNASVPLPANCNFGISYQFNDKLTVGIDVNYVRWSAYDSLIFDFKNNTAALPDSRNPRKYDNTFIYRIGAQYKLSDKFTVRAGAYYDNTPTQNNLVSPETPDGNRIGTSAGLSFFPSERLSIDASFLFINQIKRTVSYEPANLSGTYKSYAYIPGLGLSYSF